MRRRRNSLLAAATAPSRGEGGLRSGNEEDSLRTHEEGKMGVMVTGAMLGLSASELRTRRLISLHKPPVRAP